MRRAQPWRTNRARVLRDASTPAEDKLWQELRDRQLGGLKFARQTPIGPYFADFVCRERKLIVEVDGAMHASEAELTQDAARTAHLEKEGYRVYRVLNADVFENLDGTLDAILAFAEHQDV